MNPLLVRRLLYPLHERVLQRPTFSWLQQLEQSQWLSRAALERLQLDKLKTLLHAALAHSPWHAARIREASLDVRPDGPPLQFDDLRRLPLMDKGDCVRHRDQMVWRQVPGGAYRYTTGGSSGEPLVFYYGRERQAADAAGRMRARRWWGVDVGDREVFLWGAPVELGGTDRVKRFRDRLFNQLLLNAFDMSLEHTDAYIENIRAFAPKCIYGYASSVALLAARAREVGKDLRMDSLKVVCTTGEPLYPDQRRLIEDGFGVPVAVEYGSRDAGFIAHESPDGQLLQLSESTLVEVLDGDGAPVKPGEVGEVVITGLSSAAQPFIRYRTGDTARMSDAHCLSGRGLHVLGEVMGRTTDFVVRPDGTIMHALAVIYVLRELDGVGAFKFIQHTVTDVEVQVVPNPLWEAGTEAQVARGIQARLGDEVRVDVRLVESIPPEASGKYRYVVSHVPLPNGLAGLKNSGSR